MIKKGLKVRVLTGKDRKKEGEVIEIDRSKKYHAHDEKNKFKEGEIIQIIECNPISKKKRWRVIEKWYRYKQSWM